jgi:acetyl/propionyl-CoA carboxylase alpha subunit
VLIKAAAGGGGRGLRVARSDADLLRVLQVVQAEGEASFGSGLRRVTSRQKRKSLARSV